MKGMSLLDPNLALFFVSLPETRQKAKKMEKKKKKRESV